jgi:hypothetical protein
VLHFTEPSCHRDVEGADVSYCTVVEFEWEDPRSRAAFEKVTASGPSHAEGRLVRILGSDDSGARAIEVWSSPEDARRFAESASPALDASELPAPTRVFGFEVSTFDVA